jgi:hypothetical protein
MTVVLTLNKTVISPPLLVTYSCPVLAEREILIFVFISADDSTDIQSAVASLNSYPCGGRDDTPCTVTLTSPLPCRTALGGVVLLKQGDGYVAAGIVTSVECSQIVSRFQVLKVSRFQISPAHLAHGPTTDENSPISTYGRCCPFSASSSWSILWRRAAIFHILIRSLFQDPLLL